MVSCPKNCFQQPFLNLKQKLQSTEQRVQSLAEIVERSNKEVTFHAFELMQHESILQKKLSDGVESYSISNELVTSEAKFVLADIFMSDSKNDHFVVVFSGHEDCQGHFWSEKVSGKSPPNNFDRMPQKAIIMMDASQLYYAHPRWGQWT